MRVRPATPADETAVSDLLAESYPPLMAASYDADTLASALPSMTRAQPALLACGTFYIAEDDDGSIVGCGGWTFERPGSGDVEPGLAHIRHFGVHPAAGRRGVGRALFERCRRDAVAAGAERFECYSSRNAEPFYAAMGLERIAEIIVDMGPAGPVPSVLMDMRLT